MAKLKLKWWTKRRHKLSSPQAGLSILGLLGLFALITLLTVYQTVRQSALQVLERDTHSSLLQWHGQLDAELKRHAYLPALLAVGQEVQTFLSDPQPDNASVARVNAYLAHANRIAHTAVIYVLRADGQTLAASNWQDDASFIGQNFSFRPYYQQAMRGELAHYFALGTTSGERGYYFAAPVWGVKVNAGIAPVLGAVVVKIDVNDIEAAWAFDDMDFIATDANGVVFMSSRASWLYRALQPLSAAYLAELSRSQRYHRAKIQPLIDVHLTPRQSNQHITVDGVAHLVLHYDMDADAGWQLYLLANESRVTRSVAMALLLAAMMLVLSILLVYLLWKNQRQRREYEHQARRELAAKVEERTRELRKTQEELVQAAKMAALGQLSAGINHEINNPLTAIRAYADNAVQFLDIGKTAIVRSNLTEIVALTERMAAITRQLKTFSRKSTGQIERCDLGSALDAALRMVQPKLTATKVDVQQQRDETVRYAWADAVWLEQILVNLLTNAVEAVQEHASQTTPCVWVSLTGGQTAGQVCIQVRDNGVGISDTIRHHVFEAFFTTKTIGKGLGLGLSISYRLARDMHGDLSVQNAPEGGAIFTLTLPIADSEPCHDNTQRTNT